MKQLLNSILLAVVLIMMVLSVTAQEERQNNTTVKQKWVLEKGCWVVESNIHTPKAASFIFITTKTGLYSGEIRGYCS